jgi:trimethylamine--corrinoid protein Co-methyltransferase
MARGRRRARRQSSVKLAQLPWRDLVNPYPPLEILSQEEVERVHATSMRILEELGIEVTNGRALDLFAAAGADVDRAGGNVRLSRGLVAEALASVPAEFTLTPRNPQRAVTIGGRHLNFGLVAGPPNIDDRVRGRRTGNYEDYCDFIRLAQTFNAIHLIGNQVVAPIELPANSRHLDTYLANLTLSDRSYHCTAIGRGRAMDGITMMAISRGMAVEDMLDDPGVITIISVNSPRKLDDAMAEGLITMSEYGQAVVVTPFTLMGAMAPITLPAALAQQNAEALFGIVLTQLVRKGAPAAYGAFTTNVDMRSGAPAFGTPENTKANLASGQLARRYGLPYRTSNANAANVADAQAAYETQMSLWGAVLGGAHLVYHAAGWLEGGLTASFEKFIIDVEMLQHMMEVLAPVEVNEATLGFDAMRDVAAGGHFFGEHHTLERYETAFYSPLVSNWQSFENWSLAGASDTTQRATAVWQQALREYEEPMMEPSITEALRAYVERRREDIGTGEP